MNQIETLKHAVEVAQTALEAKRAELAAQGVNAKGREKALKGLKAAAADVHAVYSAAAKGHIHRELTKIINESAAERKAAKIARSPWKQAKAVAGLKV